MNFSVTVSPGRTVIDRGEKVNSFIVISITLPAAGFPGSDAHATAAIATRRRAALRSASDEADMGEASVFAGTPPRAERHSPMVQRLSFGARRRSETAECQADGDRDGGGSSGRDDADPTKLQKEDQSDQEGVPPAPNRCFTIQ
ncbi:MAG TPA: hypothetical protein VMQ78_10460 [Candidatus Limnocylindria bacterium]|nr:hypothetical protein [Candidatus Limnocylindria bacterium]